MNTFLDKLKKGMGAEEEPQEEPQEEPELEEIIQEEPKESKEPKEPMKEKIPKKKGVKKEKTVKKKEKIEFKKIKVDEKPLTFSEEKVRGEEKKWLEPEGQLTVDVYQTDKDFVVQSAIAGVQTKDLDISIDNDMLIIKGKREKSSEEEGKIYSYQECFWGPFSREIVLPEEVDCSRIAASMKEGILTIKVPKIKRRTNTRITIGV